VFAGLLALLHSVGVEVSSVIAGFGVGGLAMALSTQTVLQDVSAGLALLVDRPFELGTSLVPSLPPFSAPPSFFLFK
jgi:small-conductance mechanosensitive channel